MFDSIWSFSASQKYWLNMEQHHTKVVSKHVKELTLASILRPKMNSLLNCSTTTERQRVFDVGSSCVHLWAGKCWVYGSVSYTFLLFVCLVGARVHAGKLCRGQVETKEQNTYRQVIESRLNIYEKSQGSHELSILWTLHLYFIPFNV